MTGLNWIFLRGIGREGCHWGRFITEFRRRRPHDFIYFLDFPGVGQARHQSLPWSLSSLVSQLRQNWLTNNPEKESSSCCFLALSFGGMVALQWAILFPQDVQGLVVMNSSSGNLSTWTQRLRLESFLRLGQLVIKTTGRERQEEVLRLISRRPEDHQDVLSTWMQIAKERPPTALSFVQQLWLAQNFKIAPRPQGVKFKTFFLASLGDEVVDPSCSEALARAWSAPIFFHPWAGHDLTLDDPQWVLDQLESFFPVHEET